MTLHRGGLQRVSPYVWPSLTVKALLFHEASTAAPNVDDVYVSSVVPASNELVNTGYSRVTLTGLASTYNTTTNLWELEADDVDFGALTGDTLTTGVTGWAIYAFVTNDADSILIRSYTGAANTLTGDHVRIAWTGGIVATVAEA